MSQEPNFPRDDADALDTIAFPEPGTVRRGTLRFSHPDLAEWSWPYTVVRGAEDGPHVALISGVHPAEYPAIESNIRFTRNLDPVAVARDRRLPATDRRAGVPAALAVRLPDRRQEPESVLSRGSRMARLPRSWTTPSSAP